jgi:hypothetical protein
MRQFRIDDSERDRILNLHENATKRQYLTEQPKSSYNKYLTEQDGKCLPINQVIGIENFVKGNFDSLTNIMGQEIIEVCKSDTFGDITEYTFTMESNPNLKVASFKIDGDLTPKKSGA